MDDVAGGHGKPALGGAHGQSARIVDTCRDSMAHDPTRLVQQGVITRDEAKLHAENPAAIT